MTSSTSKTPRTDALWNREEWGLRFKAWREHARQLERELAEARRDAQRYCIMRKAAKVKKYADYWVEANFSFPADPPSVSQLSDAEQFDAAIDAAIESEKGDSHE